MDLAPAETVPPVIGKYRLLAELGHGGMARVFLAVASGPSGFSKLVVLKMIRMHLAEDPDAVQMFLDEARLAGRLNHPNVVHTHEVVEEGGRYMMVMEYLEGQSLSAVFKRARAEKLEVPQKYQLRAVLDSLQGLHYAHTVKDFDGTPLSLVHRDVSPQNIFITYDGQVKVLDFGIAKAVTSSAETKAGVIKGKIAYMAPEQFLGETVDNRADIFAVGAILWHVAAGQRLWKGVPDVQVIGRAIRGEVMPPSTIRSDVHPELERITMKALAIQRTDRYEDALELHEDLEAFIESVGWKSTAREVGVYVADMFDDLRTQITQTIESQLSKARSMDTGVFERAVLPAILTHSGSQITPMGSGSNPFGPNSVPPGVSVLSSPSEDVLSSSTRSNVGAIANSIPGTTAQQERKRSWFPLVAAFGIIAGFAAALFLVPSLRSMIVGTPDQERQSTAAAPASQPDPQPVAPVATVDEAPQFVEVTIDAKPASARLFFDGEELMANPTTKRVRKDGAVHRVRAEAKGYEDQMVEVTADKDTGVTMALDRAGAGGGRVAVAGHPNRPPEQPDPIPSATTPSAPPPATTKPKEPAGGSGGSGPTARDRIKNLDKSNPWEQ